MSSSHKHEDEDKGERIARPICDQWVALSARTSGGGGGGEGVGGTATDAGPLFAPPLAPAEATVAAGVGVSGKNPPLSNQSPEMSWRAGLFGSGASEIKTAHAHSREDADECSPPSQLDLSTLLGINDAGSGGNTGVGALQMPRMPSALNPSYPPLTNGLERCGQGGQQGPYDRMMATAISAAATAAAATTAAGSRSEAAGTGEFSFRSFPSAEIFGSISSISETVAHREIEEGGWAAESSMSAAKTNLLQQQQQQRRLQQQLVQQQQLLRLRFQQQRLQQQELQQRRQFQVRLQQRRQQQQAVFEERESASAAEDGTSSWHSGSIDDM